MHSYSCRIAYNFFYTLFILTIFINNCLLNHIAILSNNVRNDSIDLMHIITIVNNCWCVLTSLHLLFFWTFNHVSSISHLLNFWIFYIPFIHILRLLVGVLLSDWTACFVCVYVTRLLLIRVCCSWFLACWCVLRSIIVHRQASTQIDADIGTPRALTLIVNLRIILNLHLHHKLLLLLTICI